MKKINNITEMIIGSSITVHRELGPGLLESAYGEALIVLKIIRQKSGLAD